MPRTYSEERAKARDVEPCDSRPKNPTVSGMIGYTQGVRFRARPPTKIDRSTIRRPRLSRRSPKSREAPAVPAGASSWTRRASESEIAPPPSGSPLPPEVAAPAVPVPEGPLRKAIDAGARHCASLQAWKWSEPETAGGAPPVHSSGISIANSFSYTESGASENANFFSLPSG
jgi:hypothetical protein